MENNKISGYCKGEYCKCGEQATRKVAEVIFDDDPNPNRHELTTYICEVHFNELMNIPHTKKTLLKKWEIALGKFNDKYNIK